MTSFPAITPVVIARMSGAPERRGVATPALLHFLLAGLGVAHPAADKRVNNPSSTSPSSIASVAGALETMPYASDNPNNVLWRPNNDGTPDAVRGSYGASILASHNGPMVIQNPDMAAPPVTDYGSM